MEKWSTDPTVIAVGISALTFVFYVTGMVRKFMRDRYGDLRKKIEELEEENRDLSRENSRLTRMLLGLDREGSDGD